MKKEIKFLITIGLFVILAAGGFFYFLLQNQATNSVDLTAHLPKPKAVVPMVANVESAHSFSYGPENARVTVVEFFDPECESCSRVAPLIKKEMAYYKNQVRWIFRYMPYHYNSKAAIAALEAARKQNLFLEALDLLYDTQSEWGERQYPMNDKINEIVLTLKGLQKEKYLKDLNDPAVLEIIEKDKNEGQLSGVTGTPTFYVNNVIVEELNLDILKNRIEAGLGN